MRGKLLHNQLASEIKDIFNRLSVPAQFEYGVWHNGMTAYFDIGAFINGGLLACEIETTLRNVKRNIQKAQMANAELWIVVPTRKLRGQLANKLRSITIMPAGKPIKLLLSAQLQQELMNKLSSTIAANRVVG